MSPNEAVVKEEKLPARNWASVGEVVFDQPKEVVAAALQGSPEQVTKTQVEDAIKKYLQTPANEG